MKLEPGACGATPVGRMRVSLQRRALWIEMASPRPRVDASDTFFLGPAPDGPAPRSTPATRATTTCSCSRTARWTSIAWKRGQAMGAPTVSGSMATAVLAYSGIAVKMLVDQRLDAQLHTMFMVDYQPGACANPHDHPFEESYYMLEGEVDVVADGDRHTLRPGDVLLDRDGVCTRSTRPAGAGAVARDIGAWPLARHSYRHERDWNYLAERLAADAGVGAA